MSIIANTTVISNLASVDQLDLLRQLYGTLHIPIEVFSEIQDGLDEGYAFYAGIDRLVYPLNDDGWIHLSGLSGEELRLFSGLPARLHKGEAACIAIAKCRGWQFLSDDLEARKYARQLDVRVSGTVGCLVLAIERDRCSLDEANEWLHAMLQRGFRSPVLDLTPLLSKR